VLRSVWIDTLGHLADCSQGLPQVRRRRVEFLMVLLKTCITNFREECTGWSIFHNKTHESSAATSEAFFTRS
jgi:hypothetical protein